MLLAFRVINHRSLRDEQELSLVVPVREEHRLGQDQAFAAWDTRVSPVAGVYGPNASGKSNVLHALGFMQSAVLGSHARWAAEGGVPVQQFAFRPDEEQQPSLFEVQLELGGTRHQYGFEADAGRIRREWLHAWPQGRRQLWFERTEDSYHFSRNLTGRNRTIADLTRPNSLYLSTAAAGNHEQLRPLHHWFATGCLGVTPGDQDARTHFTIRQLQDAGQREQIVGLLQAADLGIRDAVPRRAQLDPGARQLLTRLLGNLEERADGADSGNTVSLENETVTVELLHTTGEVEPRPLPFAWESQGTRTWFALLGPLLQSLQAGAVLLVDELDASLHPQLTAAVVRLFQDPATNPRQAQLLFTTHDTALLGSLLDVEGEHPPLRRDQIWFTERDQDGATTLYSLSEFSPRRQENIERGYLQGRYGAVPHVREVRRPEPTPRR